MGITTVFLFVICLLFFPETIQDWGIAALLSAINAVSGYLAARMAISKSHTRFIQIVFGAMVARVIFLLLISVILIKFQLVKALPFVLGLFGFYILHQGVEIFFLNRQLPAIFREYTGRDT
jgi:uncharacterized membrane protein